MFGPRLSEIKQLASGSLNEALDLLLAPQPVPEPPLLHRPESEPNVSVGETWVYTPYGKSVGRYRGISTKGWFMNNVLGDHLGIREKMTLFWVNYFAITSLQHDGRAVYSYLRLYQDVGIGNLRSMIERITIEPSMLKFLDGESNSAENPNENYARELLELFTIQKGPLVAPGDYTNFTEQDVVALARALTGWKQEKYEFSSEDIPVACYFDPSDHDTGTKQMSYRFDNVVIGNEGENEYKRVIEIILAKRETARAFCRELYRYFVHSEITPEIESEVIEPMGVVLYEADYEIAPALRALLGSRHFYETEVRGVMIKNPYEFIAGAMRPLGNYDHLDLDLRSTYGIGINYNRWAEELNMQFFDLPTVAGWKAYYDAPQYYRHWISPALLRRRYNLTSRFVSENFAINDQRLPIDWSGFISSLTNAYAVNDFIEEVALIFFPRPLHPDQLDGLKEALLQGLPDSEWSRQLGDYFASPNDNSVTRPVEDRLRRFFSTLFGMVEFQLQ